MTNDELRENEVEPIAVEHDSIPVEHEVEKEVEISEPEIVEPEKQLSNLKSAIESSKEKLSTKDLIIAVVLITLIFLIIKFVTNENKN